MELARRVGLQAAPVQLSRGVFRKDVLLVERFDRQPGTGHRLAVVSASTILQLGETPWRWRQLRGPGGDTRQPRLHRHARAALRELFARITFNILVGNTDDHARNHAAFWHQATVAHARI